MEKVGDTVLEATPIIALDSNDTPHIVYSDYGWQYLRHAYKTSGQWMTERIDGFPGAGSVGIGASFAIGTQNGLHVSYYYCDVQVLKACYLMYATKEEAGDTWNVTMLAGLDMSIFESYQDLMGTSLVLDSRGYPHIAYFTDRFVGSDIAYVVAYVAWNGSSWSGTTTDCWWPISSGACGLPSLALDARDQPHISFFKDFADPPSRSGEIVYATLNGISWDLRGVYASKLTLTSIVVDSYSKAHIFYSPDSQMRHTMVGTNMTTEVVDPQGGVWDFHPNGAAIDRAGGYHVVYSRHDPSNSSWWVRYAHRSGWFYSTVNWVAGDGGGWRTETQVSAPSSVRDGVPVSRFARNGSEVVLDGNVRFGRFRLI